MPDNHVSTPEDRSVPTSDNSDGPDARMRRSARLAVGAGILFVFILGLVYDVGWGLSLVRALLFAVVVLTGARIALGRMLWKLLS